MIYSFLQQILTDYLLWSTHCSEDAMEDGAVNKTGSLLNSSMQKDTKTNN